MDTDHVKGTPESTELRHEVRDVSVRPIVYFGIGLFLLVCLSFALMKGMFGILDHQAEVLDTKPTGIMIERPQEPPQPRLQTTPVPARKQIQANENALLGSYGWVNEKTGTVRIPIQRAMELLAERKLPARSLSEAEQPKPGESTKPPAAANTEPLRQRSTGH